MNFDVNKPTLPLRVPFALRVPLHLDISYAEECHELRCKQANITLRVPFALRSTLHLDISYAEECHELRCKQANITT